MATKARSIGPGFGRHAQAWMTPKAARVGLFLTEWITGLVWWNVCKKHQETILAPFFTRLPAKKILQPNLVVKRVTHCVGGNTWRTPVSILTTPLCVKTASWCDGWRCECCILPEGAMTTLGRETHMWCHQYWWCMESCHCPTEPQTNVGDTVCKGMHVISYKQNATTSNQICLIQHGSRIKSIDKRLLIARLNNRKRYLPRTLSHAHSMISQTLRCLTLVNVVDLWIERVPVLWEGSFLRFDYTLRFGWISETLIPARIHFIVQLESCGAYQLTELGSNHQNGHVTLNLVITRPYN